MLSPTETKFTLCIATVVLLIAVAVLPLIVLLFNRRRALSRPALRVHLDELRRLSSDAHERDRWRRERLAHVASLLSQCGAAHKAIALAVRSPGRREALADRQWHRGANNNSGRGGGRGRAAEPYWGQRGQRGQRLRLRLADGSSATIATIAARARADGGGGVAVAEPGPDLLDLLLVACAPLGQQREGQREQRELEEEQLDEAERSAAAVYGEGAPYLRIEAHTAVTIAA